MKEIITIEINTGKSLETISALKEELKKQNKELENMSFGTEAYKQQEKSVASLKTQLSVLTTATKEQTKIEQLNKIATESQTGSYNQLSAQYKINTIELNKMSAEQQKNTAEGQKLVAETKAIRDQMKLMKQAVGDNSLNVGNYAQALDVTNMNLREMQIELKKLRTQKFDGLNPEEIKMVKDQMANLTEGIRDFQEEIKTASESGIPGIVAGFQGIIATTQLVTGTLNLFGVENEKLEKSMVQLIGISQALTTVEDVIAKKKIQVMALQVKDMVIKGALAIKTAYLATVNWIAVTAQNAWTASILAFNTAIYNIPVLGWILLIITAIIGVVIALVKYWDKLTSAFKSLGKWMGITGDESDVITKKTETYTQSIEKLIKSKQKLIESGKHELNLMKARGDSIDDIKAKERELMLMEIENAKLRIKMEISKGGFSNERLKAIGDELTAIKELKKELEVFDTSETKRKKDEAQKQIDDNKKKNDKIAEENTKAREKQKQEDDKFLNDITERGKTEMQKLQEKHDEELSKLDELHAKGLIKTEQYAQMKLIIEKQLTDKKNEIAQQSFTNETAKIEFALKQRYADGLINEQEYNESLLLVKISRMQAEIEMIKSVEGKEQEVAQKQLELDNFIADNKIKSLEEVRQMEIEHSKFLEDLKIKNAENEIVSRDLRLEQLKNEYLLEQELYKDNKEILEQLEIEYNENVAEIKRQSLEKQMMDTEAVMGALSGMLSSAKELELKGAEGNEKKQLQIKKKYADKEAAIAIAKTTISTAQAIMQAVAQLGPIAGAIAGVLLGITGALQIANIVKERNAIKSMARGGNIGGRSHSQGGTLIEAERGEAIINKRSVAMFPQQLSAINQAGGGVPIFAQGGMIGNVVSTNETLKAETQIEMNRMLINAISKMPPPIVMVEEMSTKLTENSYNKSIGII